MNPRRVAIEMWPTLVFTGGLVVWFAVVGLTRNENASATRVVNRLVAVAPLAANAGLVAAPPATAMDNPVVATGNPVNSSADLEKAAELLAQVAVDATATPAKQQTDVAAVPDNQHTDATAAADTQQTDAVASPDKQQTDATAAVDKQQPIVVAALTDPAEILPPKIPTVQAPTASTDDPSSQDATTTSGPATPGRIELVGECLVAEPCIDQFLWALYERTPKEDTTKETERRKVTIKRKGKLVTVTRSFTRLVDNDFTWKDPKAAERVRMSMMDYVIGGMDRSFKIKLFHALYAAEAAGLQPGITSAFRDDYRQSIASGLKAASDRSYHGGSFRGGYGRGLAADIVSVNGATRAKRWVSTEALWKWVDANGKQFGIGRPYLDRDPPHVGPIDGQEYSSRRGGAKVASADVKKRQKQAAQAGTGKRQVAARSSNGKPSGRLAEAR
jgi:hypothetical protein